MRTTVDLDPGLQDRLKLEATRRRLSFKSLLNSVIRGGLAVTSPRSHVPYTRRILRSYGLEQFVTDIKPIGVYQNVRERKAEIFDTTVKLIKGMVEDGAEIIIPLGGALIPYVVNPDDLSRETGVQVLNTKAIGIAFAEMCVRNKMTQSALTYPRAKLNYADFTKTM